MSSGPGRGPTSRHADRVATITLSRVTATEGTERELPDRRGSAPGHDLPAAGEIAAPSGHSGVHRALIDGEGIELPRWHLRVVLRAEETAGTMTLVDNVMQPGHAGPPQHLHDGHDEAFLLTSGRLRFRIGDRFLTGEPGQVVYAGRGLAHGFANPFDEPATWVLALTPSGYERYFRALAAIYADRGFLPVGDELVGLMAEQATRQVDVLIDPEHG